MPRISLAHVLGRGSAHFAEPYSCSTVIKERKGVVDLRRKTKRVLVSIEIVRELVAMLQLASNKRHLNGRQRALMKECVLHLESGLNKQAGPSVEVSLRFTDLVLRCLALLFDRSHEIRRNAERLFGWFT